MRYSLSYVRIIIPLLIIYLALTSNLEFSNILLGLLVASVVAFLIGPQRKPYVLRRYREHCLQRSNISSSCWSIS
jgi:uncharacterized membrane protein YgaE (UPF0421/DUF939 family)